MFLKISSASSTALRRLAARGIDQGGNLSPPSRTTTFNHALIPPPPGSCHCVCPLRGFPVLRVGCCFVDAHSRIFEISVIFEFRGDEYLIRKRKNPRKIRWCWYCDSTKRVPGAGSTHTIILKHLSRDRCVHAPVPLKTCTGSLARCVPVHL